MDYSEKEEGERTSDDEIQMLEETNESISTKSTASKPWENDEMGNNVSSVDSGQFSSFQGPSTSRKTPVEQPGKIPSKLGKKARKKRKRAARAAETGPLKSSSLSNKKHEKEPPKTGANRLSFGMGPIQPEPTKTGANRLPLGGPPRFGIRPGESSSLQNPEIWPTFMPCETAPVLSYDFSTFRMDQLVGGSADQGQLALEHAPLDSRLSEDMDISPVNSVEPNPAPGCVIEVNSPLESDNLDELQNIRFLSLPNPSENPLQYDQREPPPEPALAVSSEELTSLKQRKRFSKKFLDGIRSALLDALEESSSSDSEIESELYEKFQRLRDQLDYHREELRDCLEKKVQLVKELANCELVVNHHQEVIARLMRDISGNSSQLVKRLKSKNKKKKRKNERLLNEFEGRVQDLISDLARMTVPVTVKDSGQSEEYSIQNEFESNQEYSNPSSEAVESEARTSPELILQKEKRDITVAEVMLDDIERRRRKRQNLLSKEEELRKKLMKKKTGMSNAKEKEILENVALGTVESEGNQKLSPEVDSVDRGSSEKSSTGSNELADGDAAVEVTVSSAEPRDSDILNDENSFATENAEIIEKTLEKIRHCNSMNSLKSFMLDQTISVKESLEKIRCKIDPNIPICYYDVFGHCLDQNCNEQHLKNTRMSDQQLLEEILTLFPEKKNSSESIETQAIKLLKDKPVDEVIEDLKEEAKIIFSN